ncbi:hypothetical protein CDV50_08595 [Haematobacter massiliensis]|uniref:DUF1456 family protein n=1 Tax=Haematobacter massiliensis TaxID=195105 RepID=UPI000B49F630|nr:DUF1456 family protein [Haematobacter massiliensis]OWJ71862.1 hypothetical protein CDV50_08595 [Haematobacter massiliensis]
MNQSRNPYNRWFRRIKTSHAMSRSDIVKCCRIGGAEISPSTADAWARRQSSDTRRSVAMTEEQFESFTAGLVDWARSTYRETRDDAE